MYYDWDYHAAKTGIDRALTINPSFVDGHFWNEFYYTYVERDFERAVAANRRAQELDPLDLNIASRLAQVLLLFNHIDEAVERLETILRTDPDHMVSYVELADGYARTGRMDKAQAAAQRAIELSGRAVVALCIAAYAAALAGDTTRADELVEELNGRARNGYVSPFWLGVVQATLGNIDRAFEYLADAQKDHDPSLLYLSVVPDPVGLRSDPRCAEVLRNIGLGHLAETAAQ